MNHYYHLLGNGISDKTLRLDCCSKLSKRGAIVRHVIGNVDGVLPLVKKSF